MSDDRLQIDLGLVSGLIGEQFPQWSHLPVRPVEPPGWDNLTFRLAEGMSVRLPSAERYVAQVRKEHRWLPGLAPHLPLPIPEPLAMGLPSNAYPFPWSVYRWIDGEPAAGERISDVKQFAMDLAEFLVALQAIDARNGPTAGEHNFFRGGPVATYDGETRRAIEALTGEIDVGLAAQVWETALASAWQGPPVWVHGDVASGNLLVKEGRLAAVIDFGSSGVGDPACDLYIAWTFFDQKTRGAFREALPLDAETWQRGRGWALWKALIVYAEHRDGTPLGRWARGVVDEVLVDHQHFA